MSEFDTYFQLMAENNKIQSTKNIENTSDLLKSNISIPNADSLEAQKNQLKETQGDDVRPQLHEESFHKNDNKLNQSQDLVAENPITQSGKQDLFPIEPEPNVKQLAHLQQLTPEHKALTFQQREISTVPVQEQKPPLSLIENKRDSARIIQASPAPQSARQSSSSGSPRQRRCPNWARVLIGILTLVVVCGVGCWSFYKYKKSSASKKFLTQKAPTFTEEAKKLAQQNIYDTLKKISSIFIAPQTVLARQTGSLKSNDSKALTSESKTNITLSASDLKEDCKNGGHLNGKCIQCPEGKQLIGLDCVSFLSGFKHMRRVNDGVN